MKGLGIDFATGHTVICDGDGSVVFDEPSAMALRRDRRRGVRLVALGHDARALTGRAPVGLEVVRPLQEGVVTDLEAARRFLHEVLCRVSGGWWALRRMKVVIAVPVGATALERRALLEVAEEAGIGRPVLVPAPIAGALGCGVDPFEPRTHMVVDVGAGTSDVTAFCYGGILASRSVALAGDAMTAALCRHLRDEYQLIVGELAAEEAKVRASSEADPSFVIEGRDAATGRARVIVVATEEIIEAIKPVPAAIVQALSACLERLPAQGMQDMLGQGIVALGGGSLTPGFDKLVEDAFGFSVRMAERPLTCVAEGAARCLSHREVFTGYAA